MVSQDIPHIGRVNSLDWKQLIFKLYFVLDVLSFQRRVTPLKSTKDYTKHDKQSSNSKQWVSADTKSSNCERLIPSKQSERYISGSAHDVQTDTNDVIRSLRLTFSAPKVAALEKLTPLS